MVDQDTPFQRWRATMSYHGARYHGWQEQAGLPTVQARVEEAIFRVIGRRQRVRAIAAGRTDAGVHATGQVFHVDVPACRGAQGLLAGVNQHLIDMEAGDIALSQAALMHEWPSFAAYQAEVGNEAMAKTLFHARRSAHLRVYQYTIMNGAAVSGWWRDRAWHVRAPIDVGLMHEEAQSLVGHHDFSSFRGKNCQSSTPVKTLKGITVARLPSARPFAGLFAEDNVLDGAGHRESGRDNDSARGSDSGGRDSDNDSDRRGKAGIARDASELLVIRVAAQSFLHHQVRNMVGTLVDIGLRSRGWGEGDAARILEARRRAAAGTMAPAHGLCFTEVRY
ncbi:MAG: tRNA pseudouridine synthase A [Alphaproteobacteria bacterium]|nr:tRNA pseudouridine synthase A [Alphaproteobacteria bacterium]